MKTKLVVLILAFCFIGALCFAAHDAFMGTWKLNEAKSKMGSGASQNSMVVYAADGENVKITTDGKDAEGKPTHSEWTGKFDGKDYPVTGEPNTETRSYTMMDDHTLHAVNKKGGKVTMEAHIVLAADGKSRTVTFSGTDSKGNKVTSTGVYDKQ
jgi:hypothetical protein